MAASFDPPDAPRHQCINVLCGCNDLVSAGPCTEWCAANTVEAADVERGKYPPDYVCGCGHELCAYNRSHRSHPGTPERGLS